MEKKYTIGMITGIVLLVMIGAYTTLYNADYVNILDRNPDQNLFLLDFESGKKVEVMMRTSFPDCPYGVLRITPTDFTLKCGWRIAGVYSSWTEYWRTYGKNIKTGEGEWWQRNNRKRTLVDFDYEIKEDKIIVNRITPFYKGRSGSDGVLKEEFIIYEDGLKLTSEYKTENNAIHRIVYREDIGGCNAKFEPYDPYGTFVETTKDINGKKLHIYGEKRGVILVDPSIMLVSPNDKLTTNSTGDVVHLISNCSCVGIDGMYPTNITHYLYWNSTKGWNITGVQFDNENVHSNQSITYDQTLTLPAYENTWPYFWKSQCCQNGTRDFCVNSSVRIIAANVPSTITKPSIQTTLRSDESLTCTVAGDSITTRSRRTKYTYASGLTNGVINLTYYAYNSTANMSVIYNVPNLTWTWDRGEQFNLTKGYEVWCKVYAWDGISNSTWNSYTNSTPTNVTDGYPWGLNITTDYDWNFINETDWSVLFNITWSGPQSPDLYAPTSDKLYYTLTLINSTGDVAYNVSYQVLDSSNEAGFNHTSYDMNYQNSWGVGNLNSSYNFIPGRYQINLTVCDNNYSYGAFSDVGLCVSDISEEYLDFFTYSVSWGPGVSRFRVAPPGSGSGRNLVPMGQTDSVGIFKINTIGALGKMNFTMATNHTYDSCLSLRCSPNSSSYKVHDTYNVTNLSRTTILYDWNSYSKYIWCWMDYFSCSAGTIDQFDFEFVFDPPFNQAGV